MPALVLLQTELSSHYLQMSMEFQVTSPLAPTWESYFVGLCKINVDGTCDARTMKDSSLDYWMRK
jgi:hypothetical protein